MSKSPDGAWKTNFFVAASRRVSQKILEIPLDKSAGMVYNICIRGYSLMVKLQLPKLAMRVRFPLLAPKKQGDAKRISLLFWSEQWSRETASSCKQPKSRHSLGATCCRACSAGFRFPLLAPKKGRCVLSALLAEK